MMQQFSRIQIACADVPQAITEFTQLLGATPCWQGTITEGPVDKSTGDAGLIGVGSKQTYSAAWFYLENTLLELLPAQALNTRTGISGFTLKAESINPVAESFAAGVRCWREYQTAMDTGHSVDVRLAGIFREGVYREPLYRLDQTAANGLRIHITETEFLPLAQDDVETCRIDHIVLRSNDGDACVRLLAEQLGLRLALDQEKPEWGGRMLFFRNGKLTLEVIAPEGGLKAGDYFWGFALKVADMEAEHTRLQEAGVNVSELRNGRKPGTRVATVKSHSGGVPALLVGA